MSTKQPTQKYALGKGKVSVQINTTTKTAIIQVQQDDPYTNTQPTNHKRKVVKGNALIDINLSKILDIFDKTINKQTLNNASAKLIHRLTNILEAKTKLSQPYLAIRHKQSQGGTKGNHRRIALRD